MSGRKKIENLTTSWHLDTLFFGVVSLFSNVSTIVAVNITKKSTNITHIIGHTLINKSGLLRGILNVISGISLVMSGLAMLKMAGLFFTSWRFGLLGTGLRILAGMSMNLHTLRVLLSQSVRNYFR